MSKTAVSGQKGGLHFQDALVFNPLQKDGVLSASLKKI
jgi:hypothetical protein